MEPGDTRTLILSDLHLGRPGHGAHSAEALRPLWQGFDRLVLNGDTAEIHHPDNRVNAARQAFQLIDWCEQDGTEIVLLSGNHDPLISDRRTFEMANGQVFITHGDVFHPAIAPWSPKAGRLREAGRTAIDALRRFEDDETSELQLRLRASQHASRAEWEDFESQVQHSRIRSMLVRPWCLAQVLLYWWRFPKIVDQFATEHDINAQYIITGHTHHPGIWRVGGRTIVNTGSYGFPGRPCGVVFDDGTLAVHAIRLKSDHYELCSAPRFVCAIDQPNSQSAPSAAKTRDASDRLNTPAM